MKTKLMSKLFSQDTPEEYREKILTKVDEAKENGFATLEEDGEILQFAEVDGDIIIEDQSEEPMEVTKLSANPEDENDLIATAVEIPAEDPTQDPVKETHIESNTESELLSSIEIKRIPGPDGQKDDIVDDLEILVKEGIEDKEKSGTFSIRFKNVSESYARKFAKVFSAMESELDKLVDEADIDEDVDVKFEGEELRIMSVHKKVSKRTFSEAEEPVVDPTEAPTEPIEDPTEVPIEVPTEDPTESESDINSVLEMSNELVELAAEGINKENASDIKDKAEAILVEAEKLESKGCKVGALKVMCNKYSEECAACLDAEDPTEVPTEDPTEPDTWDKNFSDPKVTVTIEDLEPASVSQLLKPAGFEEETQPEDVQPVVDPNAEDQGRTFSLNNKAKSINPLLSVEIK